MEMIYRKRQKRGPRGKISRLVKSLIKSNELTDKEICSYVKEKYPESNTSVKCVQYYRYQLRSEGIIPPAKINRRKDKTILMWETVPKEDAKFTQGIPGTQLTIQGTYTGKQLIKTCQLIYGTLTESAREYVIEIIYSVPTCALFLNKLGWECIEIETTVKSNEYIKEEEPCLS